MLQQSSSSSAAMCLQEFVPVGSVSVGEALHRIGMQSREYREVCIKKSRGEFSRRLGISESTLRRMEAGDPGVGIRPWLTLLAEMDALDGFLDAVQCDHKYFDAVYRKATEGESGDAVD